MTKNELLRHPMFLAGKWASARDKWMTDARLYPDVKRACVTFARLANREYLRYRALV